jgi:arsenite methyltransferase
MKDLKDKIKEAYSSVVKEESQTASCCSVDSGSSCCGPSNEPNGFSEDYSHLPGYNPEADYSLGCGIPVELAGIKEGQTVLDLGSGAGNDVFVARSLVGEKGRVIGIDMTPEMIERANRNKEKLGFDNVEFILGDIEELSLKENSVDTVISNCVLNLVSNKLATYQSIHKVLKQDGHFCISDVVLTGPLTEKMKNAVDLYAGCIAGAMVNDEYLETIRLAGFSSIEVKKEKIVYLPDSFLLKHLDEKELIEYRKTGVQVLSITVYGEK